MVKLGRWGCAALAAPWLVGAAQAQHAAVQNTPDMTFASFAGLPSCVVGSVVDGDPAKGASIVAVRAAAGCAVPWHWHTANERLVMVTGSAHVQAKDGKLLQLSPGGFALMASRHVHRFSCATKCMLYVQSDAPFDVHYVDEKGNEVAAEQALKGAAKKAKKTK
jgi:quercetin dioxygenase-like cupin family protein